MKHGPSRRAIRRAINNRSRTGAARSKYSPENGATRPKGDLSETGERIDN
jgi:hypothetical protein